MPETKRRVVRLIAGVLVSIGIVLAGDYLPWSLDVTGFGPYQLFLALAGTGAVIMFVASAAGAIVARSTFVGPAVLLAIGVWYLAVSFLTVWSDGSDSSDAPSLLASIGGLTLTIGGAVLGAQIGQRFSNRNEGSASNAN